MISPASVGSDMPLPADPVARSLLAASIRAAATERRSPVGDTPELAEAISGKSYVFGDNALHIKTFSLHLVGANPAWEATTVSGKPDQFTQRFGGPIGLDGVFRMGPPASYGIDAVKGRWVSQHSFEIERRILGHGETQLWTLTFDDRTVDVGLETTDGFKADAHGEASN